MNARRNERVQRRRGPLLHSKELVEISAVEPFVECCVGAARANVRGGGDCTARVCSKSSRKFSPQVTSVAIFSLWCSCRGRGGGIRRGLLEPNRQFLEPLPDARANIGRLVRLALINASCQCIVKHQQIRGQTKLRKIAGIFCRQDLKRVEQPSPFRCALNPGQIEV